MTTTIGEPRVVPAGHGVHWWSGGIRLFLSAPWTWIGIMIIYLVISAIINFVPFIGSVGQWLLTPVFMGGLMLGCQAIERDGILRVTHLFEGFQGTHFVPLLIIGAVNIGLALAIGAIAAIGIFGGFRMADIMSGGDPLAAFAQSAGAVSGTGILVMLLVLVIVTVFAMLNWFAPALVALRGATAVEAMKLSFQACWRNWVPFLIYGLIALAVSAVVMVVITGFALAAGITALSSSTAGIGAMIGFGLLLFGVLALAGLVIGPVMFASAFTSYKDTLDEDGEAVESAAYR